MLLVLLELKWEKAGSNRDKEHRSRYCIFLAPTGYSTAADAQLTFVQYAAAAAASLSFSIFLSNDFPLP